MCIEKNNCCWAIWQTPSWGIVMKTTTVEFISATHFSFGQKWMLHFHLSTFFPSSLLLLLLSIRHEILIFDQWKSIHILLSELRNSEGREDSNSALRSGYSWGILFFLLQNCILLLLFTVSSSKCPSLNTKKARRGMTSPSSMAHFWSVVHNPENKLLLSSSIRVSHYFQLQGD